MIADHHAAAGAAALDAASQRLVNASGLGFLTIGADGRLVDCSRSAERLFARHRGDLIGHPSWEVAGLDRRTPFGALVQDVAASRVAESAEIVIRNGGGDRLVAVHAFPFADGVEVDWSDITAARTAELRLALSEARLEEVADGMPAAAWLSRADGALIYVSSALVAALGRPRRELLGQGWIDALDPADRAQLLAVREAARAEHKSIQYEGRFRRPDGSLRRIQLFGRPRFDALGGFCGHVGLARDVTEAREAEALQATLVNELKHRVNNTLSTVQALVRHTLREHSEPGDAERAVVERIMALSVAHGLLSRECWTGVDVGDLVRELVAATDAESRITVTGPGLRISPKSAIALAMGLHELAADAVAQGALSQADGRVEVDWRQDGDRLALEWREVGGPRRDSSEANGFGEFILRRMFTADLGEPAERIDGPDGLICRMRAPVVTAITPAG